MYKLMYLSRVFPNKINPISYLIFPYIIYVLMDWSLSGSLGRDKPAFLGEIWSRLKS